MLVVHLRAWWPESCATCCHTRGCCRRHARCPPQVRIAAGETLVSIASLIKKEDLGPRVLTIVLQLAHDDEHEDLRMTAVRVCLFVAAWVSPCAPGATPPWRSTYTCRWYCTSPALPSVQAVLLNELAETLGPDLCHQFVTPEVICLSEDPVFRVRKATALNLDAICRTASATTVTERLIPAFLKLSKDDIWGVRKACAESLVAVSNAVDVTVRVQVGILLDKPVPCTRLSGCLGCRTPGGC